MRKLPLLALFLAVPAFAAELAPKDNPCYQNQQFGFFEVMFEAAPLYAPSGKVEGAPARSVILTMDRCDVRTEDHVERKPMTPTAERWYTQDGWGLILTTALGSDKTYVTVVSKKLGAWTTSAQMGEYVSTDLFDVSGGAKRVVKLAHYQQGGVELPYQLHVSIRPSWSR
jgi:hypothetical protein